MIRLLSICFSVVCLAIFVWFGVTVDLGERTLFGHLRAIGTSREAKDLWEGTKAKVNDFIGIEAAKRAAAAKARERAPARDKADSRPDIGRVEVAPAGPPQEALGPRDQQQMRDQMQKLSGGKRAVQGRTPPREPARPGGIGKPAPAGTQAAKTGAPAAHPPGKTGAPASAHAQAERRPALAAPAPHPAP